MMLLIAFITGTFTAFAQVKPDKKDIPQAALDHIRKNKQKLGLEDEDFAELELSSETESKKSGVKHVYLKQFYKGIEIHGTVTNISLSKDGKVVAMGNRLQRQVGKKVKPGQANLDAAGAVAAAARYLGTTLKEPLTVQERSTGRDKAVLFSKAGISLEPIPARLVYQPMEDGSLRLAWEVSIYEIDAQNWWNLRLDASTGEVLDKDNMVVHCQFENNGPGGAYLHDAHSHTLALPYVAAPQPVNNTNMYNVFAMPNESPSHGARTLVSTSAADQMASPKGWQYSPAGSFTTTRGNNVFAYEDPNNNNSYSLNYSPDGGADLRFDFPIDFTKQPVANRDAAITNLYYWNNLVHDVWYQYGFDEASGNFQYDTFGKGGSPNDPVLAEAQDNRNGTSRNNANFSTPVDGYAPRMQMYLWSSPADPDMVSVTSPAAITGSYTATEAAWARKLTSEPLTGNLVLGQGSGVVAQEGCGGFTNAAEMAGNIAVVYRGSCAFTEKVEGAQNAGAIAVIIINNVAGNPIAMGGTPTMEITIPAVMIGQDAGALIRERLDAGEVVTVRLKDDGRPELDGDFDNGIIVHEYGHGISNRLTGGRLVANCLNNAEQMGEGWSDWFGLMMTMKPGDTRGKVRGIGTYAKGQPTDGPGIRPAPYSTDFGVNSYTYAATNDAAISQPHGIGFVWSTMLWDMTWDLIDKYGFDEDLYNGKGGNNMAMQLVIDGLKLQNCRPGFIDGRDAVLLADQLNYGGANQELIWRAFTKRGLGYSATQGANTSRFDQVEAFDLPPLYACEKPQITVVPTSKVYTGAAPTTIFLGYGAQSVVLQASGSGSYNWSPAVGLSNPGISNPTFTPTAAGIYTFTVTGVDNAGCTKSNTVTIEVVDVRCGDSKNQKVLVCVDGITECVNRNAVPALLTSAKGKLGNCGLAATATATAVTVPEAGSENKLSLRAVPNPLDAQTEIDFTLTQDTNFRLEVVDMKGSSVAMLAQGAGKAGQYHSYQFTRGKLQAGVYIVRLITDKEVSFTRIVINR